MSFSNDKWEPVSDDVVEVAEAAEAADDSEMTLTYRKGNGSNGCSDNFTATEEKEEDGTSSNSDFGKSSAGVDIISFEDENEDTKAEENDEQNDKSNEVKRSSSKTEHNEENVSNNVDALSFTDSEDSRKLVDKRRRSQLSSLPSPRSSNHRKSASSLDVSVPLTLKSSPADPHLSDVNSISSTEKMSQNKYTALNSVSNIMSNAEQDSQSTINKPAQEIPQRVAQASFFDNMISSLSFKTAGPNGFSNANKTSQNGNGKPTNPPDIITHRRQTSVDNKKLGSRKDSVMDIAESPLQQAEKPKEVFYKTLPSDNQKFDPKRFVDEKYLDTPFHYASEERNVEFHSLFTTMSKSDRLLDDFSCTLSREFLYQGRIYVSVDHLCFHSNLLGWVAKAIIPFKDVTYMEKTSTAGLFPNAISIETENGRTQFNGFISRDGAFTLIKEVWSRALLQLGEGGNQKSVPLDSSVDNETLLMDSGFNNKAFGNMTRPSEPPSRASFISENDSIIEDAIRSVDDYTPSYPRRDSEALTDEYSDDEEDNGVEAKDEAKVKVYKLKQGSKYDYDGPYYGKETQLPFTPENGNDYVLSELEYNAPPGVVFQLLFSGNNPSFWLEFFQSQDSSNFSDIGNFENVDEEGCRYRNFTYAKGLHFPVGPKSTKCVVEEKILHMDYSDYIDVLNTTRTPDVPSGGSFSTKTRYLFRWGSATTCILKVSFFVDWTAGSWIKSMVESSCKSGQISATKDLVKQIQRYVEDNTFETFSSIPSSPKKTQSRSKGSSKSSKDVSKKAFTSKTVLPMPKPTAFEKPSAFKSGNSVVLLSLVVIIALLALNLIYQIIIKKDLDRIIDAPFFKLLAPENHNFHAFARSLVDIPAKANNSKFRELLIPKLWAALQDKVVANFTDVSEVESTSNQVSREQLITFIETLLKEISDI